MGKNLKSQKPNPANQNPYPRLRTNESTLSPNNAAQPERWEQWQWYLKLYVMIVSSDGTKTYFTAGC